MTNFDSELIEDIIWAARYGELEDVKACVAEHGADLAKAQGPSGNTPLHMASANGHLEVVHYFIELFSSLPDLKDIIQRANDEGNTPLHWSALNGHLEVVKALVEAGADAKIKNKSGRTPIFDAQQGDHEKVVDYLLETMAPEEEEDGDEEAAEDEAENDNVNGEGSKDVEMSESR
ncbi:uncharacterized protein VTP21DRAFT_479 [Calcarisporiella thermophila]|uniref:uncharacterized protein n=1 Tax=Calcarisporiella thermophila TaxID=911321 RepID=UPI0037436080